jgi:bifunctional UDP-N-acetylglucosamine pyrophosphorylase/glucosamine-1-phosphate N-acetyltransferase
MMILTIILAAGKGTRMKSALAKVMMWAAGRPMLSYALDLANSVGGKCVVVTGHNADTLEACFAGQATFCRQKEQLGTADAVLAAKEHIAAHKGKVLILNGDMPLIREETLNKFIEQANAPVNFISVKMANPKGYGRVVRSDKNIKIVEEKDATEAEKAIAEVNTGVWLADSAALLERLSKVGTDNAQREYYLTDIAIGETSAWCAPDEAEFAGANDRVQLAEISKQIWTERAKKHMLAGVSIIDPALVYISHETEIAPDAEIYPNVFLEGSCKIGAGVILRHGVRVVSSKILEGTLVRENTLQSKSQIECFASLLRRKFPKKLIQKNLPVLQI